jgi:Asp-tRNA(Asn)/Glu-tRNA(Gln) amidotransferase C subunit
MTTDTLTQLAHVLAAEIALPAEDWEAVVTQARRILETVALLDELPLDRVEPGTIYEVVP